MDLDKEKDYIILHAISINGYSSMPQDYSFLTRYSLKDLYYQILNNSVSGMNIAHLEKAAKIQAKMALPEDCNFCALRSFKDTHGPKKTKVLLGENETYWKVLKSILRKGRL